MIKMCDVYKVPGHNAWHMSPQYMVALIPAFTAAIITITATTTVKEHFKNRD